MASLGLFRRLPSKLSTSTVREPSSSTREMRRLPCSQMISRPSLSKVSPFDEIDRSPSRSPSKTGSMNGLAPSPAVHWWMALARTSEKRSRCSPRIQTGPSVNV